MGWWDGVESVRTLLGGLGLNAECEMQCQAGPLPSQAPGRSQRIIKSGHPRSHWREELFVSQNVPWVRIPGSCWHTRNTWKRSTVLIQWWIHLAVMVTSTPGSYAVLIRFYGCWCFRFKVSINPPDLSVLLHPHDEVCWRYLATSEHLSWTWGNQAVKWYRDSDTLKGLRWSSSAPERSTGGVIW